ncbi:unnamed protein product [Ascophyllum nodosum]
MRVTPYREAVGALMSAATMTRPVVAYAAHQLGKFNDNPGPAHWRAAKRALQYLWRTKDLGRTCGGTPGSCTKLSA